MARAGRAAIVLLLLLLASSAGASSWSLSLTTGFGGLGFGIGALVSLGTQGEPDGSYGPSAEQMASVALITGLFTAAGITSGALIGAKADRKLARGEPLTGAHRAAVRTGTVLAGGTIGLGVGAVMISFDTDSRSMSDEALLTTTTAVGLLAGTLLQFFIDDHLDPKVDVSLAPQLVDGGVGARLKWNW